MSPLEPSFHRREVETILALDRKLAFFGDRYRVNLKPTAPTTVEHLRKLPAEHLAHIENSLRILNRSFEVCAEENVDPWCDREFFRLSMRCLGAIYPQEFVQQIGNEDLVEGYDMNRIQIFRNLRFMETSSYSMLEILSHEWPELFDRATAITEQLISYTDRLLWSANQTIKLEVPEHLIREVRSKEKQVCRVNFKNMAPLFSGPNRPYGLVANCAATPVLACT